MASAVTNPTAGAPGPVVYPGNATNTALFNDMNVIRPELIPELFDRYGAENYGMLMDFMGEIGGVMRSVTEKTTSTTRQFIHYEKGRAFPSGLVNANVGSATNGAAITVTLAPGSYTNSGTESGFQQNVIGYIGSTGIKFQVGTVTRTTNAFTVVLTPVNTGEKLASLGQASTILATEALLLVGNQAAGEASGPMSSTNSLIYTLTNSTTEIRDDYPITDVAMMNSTTINFGGGSYSYYKLGQTELNKRYMYSLENGVIEGVNANNLTNGSIGTTGTIPVVQASAPQITYTIGAMGLGDLQASARQMQFANVAGEVHFLQETNQQDDLDTLLFGKYDNGAIRYATVGGSEDIKVKYGFKSFNVKGLVQHYYVYKNFSPQNVYGVNPALGYARQNFALVIPQGVTPDAKDGTLRPNLQWVYQEVVPGMRFHTYTSGGLSPQNKTTTMNMVLTQIAYVGTRVICPQQFETFFGTY